MSFDIYGNNLKRGHCEVHPQVAEEYPCSLCQHQHSQHQRNDTSHKNLIQELRQTRERIAKLEQENENYKHSLAGTALNKIKADAIRDYGYKAIFPSMGDGFSGNYVCGYEQALVDMVSHANKLEQGE